MYPMLMTFFILLLLAPLFLCAKEILPMRYLKWTSAAAVAAIFVVATAVIAAGFAGRADAAAEAGQAAASTATGMGYIAAALSTGMACIGAGIAVAISASAAIGASAEDPSMMGRVLIFVAMGEGVTLFGLLVSIMILGRL